MQLENILSSSVYILQSSDQSSSMLRSASRMAWRRLARTYHTDASFNVLKPVTQLNSETSKQNSEQMRGLVADLEKTLAKVHRGGGDKARERHVARGKLLPRERVARLLDPGSPFLELSPLAGLI